MVLVRARINSMPHGFRFCGMMLLPVHSSFGMRPRQQVVSQELLVVPQGIDHGLIGRAEVGLQVRVGDILEPVALGRTATEQGGA